MFLDLIAAGLTIILDNLSINSSIPDVILAAPAIPWIGLALTGASVGLGISEAEAGKRESKRIRGEQKRAGEGQQREIERQERLIREAPVKRPGQFTATRKRRFQAGFAQTLRTAGRGRGLTGTPSLSTPALIAGTKEKLGA